MTPTSPPLTTLRLNNPAELLAGIPGVLGFAPADSLVLVTFTMRDRLSFGVAMRADLPPPWDEPDLVDQLCCAVVNNDPVTVLIAVVGGDGELAHRELVETLADVLRDEGVPVTHAVWASALERDAPWRCYQDEDCRGVVPDPATSSVAAAAAYEGRVTYADRAELVAQLEPDPPDVLAAREKLLANHPLPTGAEAVDRELSFIRDTIDGADPTGLDDAAIVRLGVALADVRVRDQCLAMALTSRADAAEELWLTLVRALPPPERAEPACLLGVAAYLRGQGALTTAALETAMAAAPGHRLAETLQRAIDLGTPPATLRHLLVRSVTEGGAVPST